MAIDSIWIKLAWWLKDSFPRTSLFPIGWVLASSYRSEQLCCTTVAAILQPQHSTIWEQTCYISFLRDGLLWRRSVHGGTIIAHKATYGIELGEKQNWVSYPCVTSGQISPWFHDFFKFAPMLFSEYLWHNARVISALKKVKANLLIYSLVKPKYRVVLWQAAINEPP